MIDKNTDVEIAAMKNGFIVRPSYGPESGRSFLSNDEVFVFQTMTGLCFFLHGHFNHRCQEVLLDKNTPVDAEPEFKHAVMDLRKEFETWAERSVFFGYPNGNGEGVMFEKDETGVGYADACIHAAWIAYKAAAGH